MKHLIPGIFAVLLIGCFSAEPEKTGFEGKVLPSFNLLLQDSTTYIDTKSIQPGKPIVLFYYSPHCPYSRAQMEEMIDEMSSIKDVQLFVITSWPFAEMKKFYLHYHLNRYPNIVTGLDYKNFLGNYFKVTGVPFTAVYGEDMKLNNAFEGRIYTKQIRKALHK
jgi:hypothetical protein